MRFLIDAQLPPARVGLLAVRGHLAEHVNEIGLGDASEGELWRYALEHGAAIITKDHDFAEMGMLGQRGPVIVWVRAGNTRRSALLAWFEPMIDPLVAAAATGENRLIELQ